MEERKDYYKILGITDEEKNLKGKDFEKVLKPKYRTLAKKYHPDLVKDEQQKKIAEEKFKEISEAYSVLSDEKKREEYDNPNSGFQFNGFNSGGFDINDILHGFGFDDIFGGGFGNMGGRKKGIKKGQNYRIHINLTLEELYNGAEKTIKYRRLEPCEKCNGKGYGKDGHIESCKSCGGTGQIFRNLGFAQQIATCPTCGGVGNKIINPCPTCHGNGVIEKEHQVSFDVPKGVMDGVQLTIENEGHAPLHNDGVNGDLLVVIHEAQHPIFERQGNDLIFTIEVSVIDALLGCSKIVKTIDGKQLSLKIPTGTEDGDRFKFSGKGMPNYANGSYGNMIGVIKIKMPKQLNNEEKALLEELKKKPHFND